MIEHTRLAELEPMNRIPALKEPRLRTGGRRIARLAAICLAIVGGGGIADSESAEQDSREYGLHYEIRPLAATASVEVSMKVRQHRDLLREISFSATGLHDVSGDGELTIRNGIVRWHPPPTGGELQWRVIVQHQRGRGYDAWLGDEWGLFRAEDIIPRARSRSLRGAKARTTMSFRVPADWSFITEYSSRNRPIRVQSPGRRLSQPTGWIAVGKLGVRRETIAGTRVAVAAPEGQDVRRMDILALLNWTLPELQRILPEPMHRLTIVSAGAPMWRGGLSAPASLFMHADRPLISENATSTLLHEVMHTALGVRSVDGYDWIVEGLAEFYSIELLRRGQAISEERYLTALEDQAKWSEKAKSLCGHRSGGPRTALAVTVFVGLDAEIRSRTGGNATIDDLLRSVIEADTRADADLLRDIVLDLTGKASTVLRPDRLAGCAATDSQ